MKYIIGISALYHDSSASLIKDGKILSAVQEERFSRIKHDSSFPTNSIKYILSSNKLTLNQIDKVVFYDKPFLKFERLLETYLSIVPSGFSSFRIAMPVWLREKLFLKNLIIRELKNIDKKFDKHKLLFSEHHFSHAASAFYPSPFEQACILTLDGVGEWATTTIAIGNKNHIKIVEEIYFPHSIGLLYSAFTYYLGFRVNSGEYKVMGLAPYGTPKYKDIILENIIDLKKDGSFKLNQKYFNYMGGLTMTNQKFADLFDHPIRKPEIDKLTQFHMDMAASIQSVIEEVILRIVKYIRNKYKINNLCLAGGVALNCVANTKILIEKVFDNIWVQPASGDAGGSLGSALAVWYNEFNNKRIVNSKIFDQMNGSYLGPEYSNNEIKLFLNDNNIPSKYLSDDILFKSVAEYLSKDNAIGWFQGKMEFGPRSLGARSILANPKSETMQKNLNLKVKFRESFRPFAPAILYEDLKDWFELEISSPYMLFVSNILKSRQIKMTDKESALFGIDKLNIKRSVVPAITHVDFSARIQTVHKDTNLKFHKLLSCFKNLTGCPILVNTSFNVRGEPIVCSPSDAYNCFLGTNLDFLVLGNYVIDKKDINKSQLKNYKNKYKLD